MKIDITSEEIINWWLEKYHNTTLAKVKEEHPEWSKAEKDYDNMEKNSTNISPEDKNKIITNLNNASREFYKKYSVTEEQHDGWNKWLTNILIKKSRMSRKFIETHMWGIYLNTAPNVIKDKNKNQ